MSSRKTKAKSNACINQRTKCFMETHEATWKSTDLLVTMRRTCVCARVVRPSYDEDNVRSRLRSDPTTTGPDDDDDAYETVRQTDQ